MFAKMKKISWCPALVQKKKKDNHFHFIKSHSQSQQTLPYGRDLPLSGTANCLDVIHAVLFSRDLSLCDTPHMDLAQFLCLK